MAHRNNGPLTRQRLGKLINEISSDNDAIGKPNELRDKVKVLVHELKTNTVDSPHHWGWLHLRITNLSVEECKAIAEGLSVNTDNVIWLNISPINISFEGLAYIIESLATNTRVTQVYLCGKPDNDLFDEEDDDTYLIPVPAQSLAKILKVNKSIRELTIVDSSITDDDVKTMVNGLKMNTTVTNVVLENNPNLTIQSSLYMNELIKTSKTLNKVQFDITNNTDD